MYDHISLLLLDIANFMKSKEIAELFGFASAAALCVYAVRKIIWIPFRLYFLAQYLPGVKLDKLGRWAVVTGATEGIGKQYARALARRGLDVVLISRSEDKLNTVKDEIIRDFQREVRIIKADFTNTDIYERINKELEGLEIAVLVNNVGMAQSFAPFLKTPNILCSSRDILSVNCLSMTSMCAIILPAMIARQKGVVVNVSSCLGYMGSTNSSNYAATKSYNLMISRCLQRTYGSAGITIQTLTPGMIRTKLLKQLTYEEDSITKRAALKLFSTTVTAFVGAAVNTIGWSDNCHGHVLYYFQDLMLSSLPVSMLDMLMNT